MTVLLLALLLALPSAALAQTEEDQLSDEPPAELNGDPTPEPTASPRNGDLPDTGAEPLLIALLGAGLVAAGGGLRVRLNLE